MREVKFDYLFPGHCFASANPSINDAPPIDDDGMPAAQAAGIKRNG